MPRSEAQKRADKKYIEKSYEMISLRVRKGIRAEWQASAADEGRSLAAYIVNAVEEHERRKAEERTME